MSSVRQNWAQYALALAVVVACGALVHGDEIPRAFHQQHYETRAFIQYNQENVGSLVECFTTLPYYPGLYRPVATTCYYYLGVKVFGDRVEPFKVVNVVFVVLNAFLLFLVARLFLTFAWALVAVALFASRQAHVQVVLVSVEMQTLLSVFFSLLMLYLYVRARREGRESFHLLSYLCFVLALLSKETAVGMAAVILLYEWLFERERDFRPALTHVAIAGVWVAFVFGVIRRVDSRRIITFGYSFLPSDILRNYLSYFLDFSNLLLPPVDDVVQKWGERVEGLARSGVVQVLFSMLVLATAATIAAARRFSQAYADQIRLAAFGLALYMIAMAPYAIVGERILVRYSYAGHVGVALAVAALLAAAATSVAARLRRSRA